LYPYGDTRYETRPLIDDGDDRAARRTVRFLGVGLFVAVLAVTLVLSLLSLDGKGTKRVTAVPSGPQQPATPAAIAGLGPQPGLDLGGYVQNRKAALAATKDERVAVVSLVKYVTETQAKAVAGPAPVALLVAPPGLAPAVVTTDLATWAKTQTDATRAERDEIKKLLPTVDDPAFKTFYQSEVDRLDKAVKNFSPDGAIVFGVVVKAPAAALQALGARPDVRLVDVGDTNVPDPKALYRGLRPEEQAKANEPALRPV
jgi:hypothetical protein